VVWCVPLPVDESSFSVCKAHYSRVSASARLSGVCISINRDEDMQLLREKSKWNLVSQLSGGVRCWDQHEKSDVRADERYPMLRLTGGAVRYRIQWWEAESGKTGMHWRCKWNVLREGERWTGFVGNEGERWKAIAKSSFSDSEIGTWKKLLLVLIVFKMCMYSGFYTTNA
jgi:hypothetical protein